MTEKMNLSRRKFMGVAGGLIGASALASTMSFAAGPGAEKNTPKINAKDFKTESHDTDVLVIGGGFAGLMAALRAHDAGAKVTMVVKGRLGTSGLTPFAKAVFAFDQSKESMSLDEYVAKVSRSAIQTNNPVFTRIEAEYSYDMVQELKSFGFFDSALCRNSFLAPVKDRGIKLVEQVMVTNLHKEKGRVVGASGFGFKESKLHHFNAKTVILCTGSGGFKPNGFPMCDLTHDGTMMAYNIGAVVTGKEWCDGHPASEENSASCYDNWHGQIEEAPMIMGAGVNHHLGMDLNYKGYVLGGPLEMGPPKPGDVSLAGGPYVPPEFKNVKPSGPPPSAEGGPGGEGGPEKGKGPGMGGVSVGGSTAGMAIHKAEGLVPIDESGLTSIPGLWAAGDALGSYPSGGIYAQIGGSSVGSCIQGAHAGKAAADAAKGVKAIAIPKAKLASTEEEILAPLKRESGYSAAWVTQILQGVMIPNFVLYIKKENMMKAALAYVEELRDHHVPMLLADDLHKLRIAHETANMIATAEMKMKASIMRTESRCSHYRLDYPEVDTKNWQAWLNIQKGKDGEMVFTKQPFDAWPKLS